MEKAGRVVDRSSVLFRQRMRASQAKLKDKSGQKRQEENTTGYAVDRVEYAASDTFQQTLFQGRNAARATAKFSMIRKKREAKAAERREVQREAQREVEVLDRETVQTSADPPTVFERINRPNTPESRQAPSGPDGSLSYPRSRPTVAGRVKTPEARTIKQAAEHGERTIKTPARSAVKKPVRDIKTAQASARATAKALDHAERAAELTKAASVTAMRKATQAKTAKATEKGVKAAAKAFVSSVRAILAGTKALLTALTAGGSIVGFIVLVTVLFGCALALFGGSSDSSGYTPVSAEVEAYEPLIRFYARQHGIPEYVELIKAVMMQESAGRGNDPMQASECGFNTRYPHSPNGITDPEYSIDVGIQNLADCLSLAGVDSAIDMDNIKLALQGYNYGSGYISWARNNYGGYSVVNAIEFSDMMAARYGWGGYGDKQYVAHVLRYYPFGRAFSGGRGQDIVEIALSQLGNIGGEPYWSWFGYDSHVEWCACFVSWCADQTGYIDAGAIPMFSYCPTGISWFQSKGAWEGRNYTPSPGDIIFFDWQNDGESDHVGIVERVEDGYVWTVEGNSGDMCRQKSYPIGSSVICGYGLLKPST